MPWGRFRREKKPRSVSQPSLPLDGGRLPIGYVSLDKDGHVLDVNPKWYETLGYSVEEVRGRCFRVEGDIPRAIRGTPEQR